MAVAISIIALIVSIIGIVISSFIAVYVYTKTQELMTNLHANNQRTGRINAVVAEYLNLSNSRRSRGISALIRAGIADLQSEDEVIETIARIANLQGQKNPLGQQQIAIEEVGILRLFQNITIEQFNMSQLDEIISKLRNS